MFNFLKKRAISDDQMVDVTDGTLINITDVNDEMFSKKLLGDGIAIRPENDYAIIYAPVSGTLEVLFPTGHAFCIKTATGVETMVHIGIDTVMSNGKGFRLLRKKQGDSVRAGDPIVEVDIRELKEKYDMSIMVIVTETNGKSINYISPQHIRSLQQIAKIA